MQLPLFSTTYDPHKLARRSDPATSHEAAQEIVSTGELGDQCQQTLDALKKHSDPVTAGELAHASGIPKHLLLKRLPDLAQKGLAKRYPARKCQFGERNMTTWKAT